MSFEIRLLLAVVLFVLFHFTYQAYLRRKNNVIVIKDYDEYVCEHLLVTIYYGHQEQDVKSNFDDYETKSTVYLSIFSVKQPSNDQEKEIAGVQHDVGRAVVRCLKDTTQVYQWWYLK